MDQETKRVFEIFEQISRIPRKSKNEQRISRWLLDRGLEQGFKVHRDEADNVLISVPATPGYERSPVVVLQAHMDMVCEKTADSNHDFENDPIELVYDGDLLTARDTTLGADNGMGIALALAVASSETIRHPPLELLFTVDEETGLTGANRLKPGVVAGRLLINLDSEDEGVFTIGCAGGRDAVIKVPLERRRTDEGFRGLSVRVSGLAGGHSGIDISLHRANANILLARALDRLLRVFGDGPKGGVAGLASIEGGTVRNAIPRDASCTVAVPPELFDRIVAELASFEAVLRSEYASSEPRLSVRADSVEAAPERIIGIEGLRRLLYLLLALPNGVEEMSPDMEGLVETSCNLAVVRSNDGGVELWTSQRSSVLSRLDALTRRIECVGSLAGAQVRTENFYPPWTPDTGSALLARSREVYNARFGAEPRVDAIHAGLECAVIGATYPGMDMISVGPTIRNPHSPDEVLLIPSVEKTRELLEALLAGLR